MYLRAHQSLLCLVGLAACSALAACGGGSSPHAASSSAGTGGSGVSGGQAPAGTSDVLTYHNDAQRSGQNLQETALTPTNVNSGSFGLLHMLSTDGAVDAAPLVVSGLTINGASHYVLYVVTEHDSVYAFDASSGTLLAQVSLLGSGESPSDSRSCGQVSPEIGITSTPVIDRSAGPHGTLFAVAMSKDGSGHYHQRLHALDLTTLQDRLPAQEISASAPGGGPNSAGGTLSFDPAQYKERAALLASAGQLYLAFASHCDITPYNSWIMSYDEATLAQTHVLQLTPNGVDGAIWDTGGLAADAAGSIYAVLGNGTFDTSLNAQGLPAQGDFGNAALRIAPSGASLAVADFFTPSNTVSESANDLDFGSGSVLLLVDQTDSAGQIHHLMIAGGKTNTLYVLDRDHMGGFDSSGNNAYQQISIGGGLYSSPVYFNGSVYVGDAGGTLKAYALSGAHLSATPSSQSSTTFAYPGTSPAISANGTQNAILWALESAIGSPAVLHAYNPADLGEEYYNSTQAAGDRDAFGNGNKFVTPVIADGRVFVGTPDGVAVFGLL